MDRSIARLAGRQRGVVARRQLLGLGASPGQIELRMRRGRLHEVHRGVYLAGHRVPAPLALEQAALVACGPGAVLSHRSAAILWELLPGPHAGPVSVTVPSGRRVRRPRIEIHRADLDRADIRRREGLPLSSPSRTIFDLASTLGIDDLERLVAEAHYRGLASEAELRSHLARNPGRPGAPALRRVLEIPGGPARTRSPAEREMVRLLRRGGLSGYEVNARIGGYEVDFLWRDAGLALEVDGYAAHSGRGAFERDRLKIARLKSRGIDVVPVTPRRIRDHPQATLELIRRALERTRAGPASNARTIHPR